MSEQEINANTLVEAVIADLTNDFMEKYAVVEPSPEIVLESILELNKVIYAVNEYVGLSSNNLLLNEENNELSINNVILENCERFIVKMFEQAAAREEQLLLEETEKKN